ELLVNDVALDLERRRQLTGLLRQVVRKDRELLQLLDRTDLRVDLVDRLLDERLDLVALRQPGDVRGAEALLLGPGHDLLRVEGDERGQVGPAVAVHDALRDEPVLLQPVLEVRRRDVLSARRDDDVLLAAGYIEETV